MPDMMNYISVVKKISSVVDVKIYRPKDSRFAIDGKMEANRIFDDMGCDTGVAFYCKYDECEFSFESEHIVISLLFRALRNYFNREIVDCPLNELQKTVNYEGSDGKNAKSLKILFLGKGENKSVDFVLGDEGDELIVIEVTYREFEKLVNSLVF